MNIFRRNFSCNSCNVIEVAALLYFLIRTFHCPAPSLSQRSLSRITNRISTDLTSSRGTLRVCVCVFCDGASKERNSSETLCSTCLRNLFLSLASPAIRYTCPGNSMSSSLHGLRILESLSLHNSNCLSSPSRMLGSLVFARDVTPNKPKRQK